MIQMGLLEIMAVVALLSWKIAASKLMVSIIDVCGMGRVGKNTFMKSLNNELLKFIALDSKLCFGLMKMGFNWPQSKEANT